VRSVSVVGDTPSDDTGNVDVDWVGAFTPASACVWRVKGDDLLCGGLNAPGQRGARAIAGNSEVVVNFSHDLASIRIVSSYPPESFRFRFALCQ
jgi:hypothetical protein